ncbi:MAG: hypothetical protein NC452_05220 [Eubacterium sp.]|nr:hypothetical protein [Eubacterium sp.]
MSYTVTASEPIKINLAPATLIEEILQNLSMILQTIKNTAPLYRDFGLSGNFLDKPIPVAETLLIAELYEAVEKYEPRAEIVNITFEQDITGKLNPCLEVEINVE